MTVRSRYMLAAVVGMWMAHPVPATEPARLGLEPEATVSPAHALSANQIIANTIAEHLRQSGQLRQFNIDVVYQDGTADLAGIVTDQQQREEALRIVQGVPGVDSVRDHMMVGVSQAQALQASPNRPAEQIAPPAGGPGAEKGPLPGPADPVPVLQAPVPSYYDLNPPKMPPYAWPTYAPYNNYSRVAYPTLYPYNAWPFVGPVYPFPKIPLGWRKINLEWQDGYWWYGKNTSSHDWWRLRYW